MLQSTILHLISKLDTDNHFPLIGFGSKLPPLFEIPNNCFAMNKDFLNPEIIGIKGFLKSISTN
jgi:hypothetical protein